VSSARHFAAAVAVGILAIAAVSAQEPAQAPFSEAQRRAILALGPWPIAARADPSNRVSGRSEAVAFGAALFAEPRLSRTGTLACSTCHRPDLAFVDGLSLARGAVVVDRNATTLLNVGGQRWYGWDGAADNLWAQSLRPILDRREMAADVLHVAGVVRSDPELRSKYVAAFGREPPADDETATVDVAKALAAFQETLVTGRTPFDEFRDALARGDAAGAARYPVAARRGLAIFVGEGRCTMCHGGPRFTNGEFGDIGIPYFAAPGRVDAGRYDGIRRLKSSRYNLLGPFNDDPMRSTAIGTRFVALEHRNFGEFKVPSLRNVARTAPYMHNGSVATLRDVVAHYSNLDEDRLHADGERILRPLRLSRTDTDDLVAFLESLSANER
jgi:cytochrome c peroxidase